MNDNRIWKTSKEIIMDAYERIRKYQSGELLPARTGYAYLDKALLGGFYPQHAVAIGARPGVGKSYLAQKIMSNVMNVNINPQADDYVWLRCEFEMNPEDLMLRSLSKKMGKDIQDILLNEMSDEEIKEMQKCLKEENSSRITYIPKPSTVDELQNFLWNSYMPANKDKKMVFVSIDHTALIQGTGDAKRNIDSLITMCNIAKRTFPNIFFLIISQLNRDIEGRRDPKDHMPKQSDFYQSDTLGQLCTAMVALNIPKRYGYSSYMQFPQGWYPNLERFKGESRRSFRVDGLIFHHIVKVRQRSLEEIDAIHVDIMKGYERYYPDGGVVRQERPGGSDAPVGSGRPDTTVVTLPPPPPSIPLEQQYIPPSDDFNIVHDETPY